MPGSQSFHDRHGLYVNVWVRHRPDEGSRYEVEDTAYASAAEAAEHLLEFADGWARRGFQYHTTLTPAGEVDLSEAAEAERRQRAADAREMVDRRLAPEQLCKLG